jgi:hypothetical protein
MHASLHEVIEYREALDEELLAAGASARVSTTARYSLPSLVSAPERWVDVEEGKGIVLMHAGLHEII